MSKSVEQAVTHEDAIKFLESACRNWSRVPPLVDDDIADVANALRDFMRKHAEAPDPRVKQLEEALTNAREAFLGMIADATRWDEDVDGDIDSNGRTVMSVDYKLDVPGFSFEQLTDALGIKPRYMESLKDCIDRLAIEPDPRFDGGSNEPA